METETNLRDPEDGKAGKYLIFWLLGVPLPILGLIYLFSNGC
jgi:hypothetical protein